MMNNFTYDLNPADHIIADAIGEPGDRTFFIQGRSSTQTISLILEKEEVANLAISIRQLLEELEKQYPDLSPSAKSAKILYAEEPLDPIFRIGQLIIGYDEAEDMIWLIAKALIISDSGTVVDPDDESVPTARFVATRNQMRSLSDHALEVVSKGRPICPLCNRSIDPGGHFCPRTDGHAVPIAL